MVPDCIIKYVGGGYNYCVRTNLKNGHRQETYTYIVFILFILLMSNR